MGLRGRRIELFPAPQGAKELHELEANGPAQIELRNTRRTLAGSRRRRNGLTEFSDLSSVADEDIVAIVPVDLDGTALAIFSSGRTVDVASGNEVGILPPPGVAPDVLRYNDDIIVVGGAKRPGLIRNGIAREMKLRLSGEDGSVLPTPHAEVMTANAEREGDSTRSYRRYYVSFVSRALTESSIVAISNVVSMSGDHHDATFRISGIPVGDPDDVVARRLYVADATDSDYSTEREAPDLRFVAQIDNNADTTYIDENVVDITTEGFSGGGFGDYDPPQGCRYGAVLNGYVILAGHDKYSFVWSLPDTPDLFPNDNTLSVQADGGRIVGMEAFGRTLYIFKTTNVEVWVNGGATTWQRTGIIERGCAAPRSIVQANDDIFYWGDDGDIYAIKNNQPMMISPTYSSALHEIQDMGNVYAYDCRRERVIRWFCPTEKRCFSYDYLNDNFSEDYFYYDGDWQFFSMLAHANFLGYALTSFKVRDASSPVSQAVVYRMDEDSLTDNGAPIRVMFRSRAVFNDRYSTPISGRIHRMRIRLLRGQKDQKADLDRVSVRWRVNRDKWTQYHDIDVSTRKTPYEDFHNLGYGQEIEVELVEASPLDFIVTGAELVVAPTGR